MKQIKILLQVLLSTVIIYLLLTQIPLYKIISILKKSHINLIFLSVFTTMIIVVLSTLRWKILLKHIGYNYSFFTLLKIVFITFFFNVYLPGGIVGEFFRMVILTKERINGNKISLSKVTASVITDRLIGLLGLIFLGLFGFAIKYKSIVDSHLLLIFLLISLGILVLFIFMFSKNTQFLISKIFHFKFIKLTPLKTKINNLINALLLYREKHSAFIPIISLTLTSHFFLLLCFYILSQAIDMEITFITLLSFIPIIDIISAIPISYGGVGIREAAMIFFLSKIGVTATGAMSLSVLYFANLLFVGAGGGIVYFIHTIKVKHVVGNSLKIKSEEYLKEKAVKLH